MHLQKHNRVFCVLTISLLLLSMGQPALADLTTTSSSQSLRLGGVDRYETAAKISQAGWNNPTNYAVLSAGMDENLVDALAAVPLAQLKNAPILLTEGNHLNAYAEDRLTRLGVKTVYITSGTGVITNAVTDRLSQLGIQTIDLGGKDRFETAVNIAKQLGSFDKIVITTAWTNADALSIASIAASKGMPILLSDVNDLSQETESYINSIKGQISKTYVLGGTGIISGAVTNQVPNPKRLGGIDRFDTNVEILKAFFGDIIHTKIYVANGEDNHLVDALTGSVLAAKDHAPIILTGNSLPGNTQTYINQNFPIDSLVLFGGESAVPSSIENDLVGTNAKVKPVNPIGDIYVANGTTLNQIGLPGTVTVDLNNGSSAIATLNWNGGNPPYNGNAAGVYVFTGNLTLHADITNPRGYTATVNVFVAAPANVAGTFVQGVGYQPGAYDLSAPQPTSFNWTRQSQFSGPQQPMLKWTIQTGSDINSSPAIGSDGTVYSGSDDGELFAVKPDGTLKWTSQRSSYVTSSPAIGVDGTVYVGSYDNRLYAFNPDGGQKWAFKTDSSIPSSPAIGSDGTVYVGSYDNKLYAINPDGTQKWAFLTGNSIAGSSPAIGSDGTVYVGSSDHKLYAVNPNGTMKWTCETGNSIVDSSPVIGSNGMVYIGSQDGKLYAVNPDGTLNWAFAVNGNITSSPAIGSDGTVFVGSNDGKLYAILPDGTQKWAFQTGSSIVESSPVIGSDGTVYVGSSDYKLYAIKPNGTLKWTFLTGSFITSSPAIGSDGTVYVGSQDGKLYAISALNLVSP